MAEGRVDVLDGKLGVLFDNLLCCVASLAKAADGARWYARPSHDPRVVIYRPTLLDRALLLVASSEELFHVATSIGDDTLERDVQHVLAGQHLARRRITRLLK